MLKNEIIEFCKTLGLDSVGFTQCRIFEELRDFYEFRKNNNLENEFEESNIEKRINPMHYMEDGKTIISIAFPYFHGNDLAGNGFSLYTMGNDYHHVVGAYLKKICDFIEERGGKALHFVDSNTLPERYIAYLSGIGFIGKNNMLITKKYGSYVFLGEIITDLIIEPDFSFEERNFSLINKFKECEECEVCYVKCPTKAINRNKKNCNICMSYITQKKDIEDKFIKLMDGRIFGCDSCQTSCPYNENIEFSSIEEFKPKDFMSSMDTESIISLTNGSFKETFKTTSCGWRGKNTLIRNALIRRSLFEGKDISNIKFSSEYIEKYKIRLLSMNKL
ncbi:tRNA epoxyqueuosine(34) reductase QueG [Clostridium sp.]|uniref:tRNA epoxyqueuosine(34) reductase QueG n=1 Tax=Clostridium sp. TaxID=1506 RepID=UPI0039917366